LGKADTNTGSLHPQRIRGQTRLISMNSASSPGAMRAAGLRPWHRAVSGVAYAALFSLALIANTCFAHGDNPSPEESRHHSSAIGMPGKAAQVTRSIVLTMDDTMRFKPATITVRRGETVRFLVSNQGQVRHEMVLGMAEELKEHAALMKKFPGMVHADPNQVSVDPGQRAELVWRFSKAGKVLFACLQPGHYEAGMKGSVTVK